MGISHFFKKHRGWRRTAVTDEFEIKTGKNLFIKLYPSESCIGNFQLSVESFAVSNKLNKISNQKFQQRSLSR